jgi:Protein kinase domain
MAEVYLARQVGAEGFSRRVALKKVLPHFSNDAQFAHMFVTEARIAATLNHPNIVQILDFDRDETGCLFLAMEFIDGSDLSRLSDVARERGAPFDPGIVTFAIGEVVRALDYAHTLTVDGQWLGIVHRDVSPHNVLVARSGAVKLGDFGIAKATAASTHSGTIKGKIAYMSPEQASGLQVDGRSDLFAIGVMFYELLVGQRPFAGQTDMETIAQILSGSFPPLRTRLPNIGADVEEIVHKLLRPSRDQRYASAAEALEAIVACECYPADGTSQMAKIVRTVLDTDQAPQMTPRPSRIYHQQSRAQPVVLPTRTSVVRVGKGKLLALAAGAVVAVGTAAAALVIGGKKEPVVATPDAAVVIEKPLETTTPTKTPTKTPESPVPPAPDAAPPVIPDAGVADAAVPRDAGTGGKGGRPPPQPGPPAWLDIRAEPWADVIVDGKRVGQTPQKIKVESGKRIKVVLIGPDDKKKSFDVKLKKDQTKSLFESFSQ